MGLTLLHYSLTMTDKSRRKSDKKPFEKAKLCFFFFFKILFFRERREGKRESKKHQCVVASRTPPTRDLACSTGMCPDQANWQPFGLWDAAQPTEPHRSGLNRPNFRPISLNSFGMIPTKAHIRLWEL